MKLQLEPILKALTASGVDFIIIGGAAAIIHGSAHLTYDLDICYSRIQDNLERLIRALEPFKPKLRGKNLDHLPFFWDTKTLEMGFNFTLTTELGPLDLLGELPGIGGYPEVLSYSEQFEVFGISCRVLSLEGLILNKKIVAREKDRTILPELEALLEIKKKGG